MNTIPKDLLQKIIVAAEKRNVSPTEVCRVLRIPTSVFVLSACENEISLCDHYEGALEDSINTKIEHFMKY